MSRQCAHLTPVYRQMYSTSAFMSTGLFRHLESDDRWPSRLPLYIPPRPRPCTTPSVECPAPRSMFNFL